MLKKLLSQRLSSLLLSALLFSGSTMFSGNQNVQRNPLNESPCDEKIVMECDTVYTADLVPNAGSWTNYTSVPYNYTGSEQVFEFTASASGLHIFDLDQGEGDADFMIMDACSNTAGNIIDFYWTGEQSEYIELVEGTTYYIIADFYEASGPTTVSIKVNCLANITITEPDFDCFQGLGIAPSIDEAFNLDPRNQDTFVANDFTVEPNTTFSLQQISLSTNQIQAPDHGVFNVREDNNGVPGEIIVTIEADATSAIAYAAAFNEPVYHVIFDLSEAVVFNEGVYWLEPKLTTPQLSTVWWAATAEGTDGAAPMLSEDGGATWMSMDGLESIFFVAGDCTLLGVSDMSAVNFDYFPNPVNTVLNIQSEIPVQSVEVFNILGQKLMNLSAGQIRELDMSSLTSGTYLVRATFEGGQTEMFKVVKN